MRKNCLVNHQDTKQYYLMLALLALSFTVIAGEQLTLEITAQEEQVIMTNDGKQQIKYTDLSSVIPGDVVLYTLTYTNHGEEAADSVVIANPIPKQMQYIANSARGNDTIISFSVDDGVKFDSPEKLSVTAEDGTTRPAIAADYTHIQWTLTKPVAPGSQGAVGYKAKLK